MKFSTYTIFSLVAAAGCNAQAGPLQYPVRALRDGTTKVNDATKFFQKGAVGSAASIVTLSRNIENQFNTLNNFISGPVLDTLDPSIRSPRTCDQRKDIVQGQNSYKNLFASLKQLYAAVYSQACIEGIKLAQLSTPAKNQITALASTIERTYNYDASDHLSATLLYYEYGCNPFTNKTCGEDGCISQDTMLAVEGAAQKVRGNIADLKDPQLCSKPNPNA